MYLLPSEINILVVKFISYFQFIIACKIMDTDIEGLGKIWKIRNSIYQN